MTRRAPVIAGVVGAVVLGLVVVLVLSPAQGDGTTESGLVGQVAPELSGATLVGDHFDIDDQRGRWVVVNFFATWCPPCVQEHPELVAFSERAGSTAQLVSVAFDDTEVPAVERFFAENGGSWPVITGGGGGASLDYGVKKLPESFLVDPSGVVVEKINGGVTAGQLEALILEHAASGDDAPGDDTAGGGS